MERVGSALFHTERVVGSGSVPIDSFSDEHIRVVPDLELYFHRHHDVKCIR